MSQENVSVVRRLFKAVESRDLAGLLAAYDTDVVIHEARSLPYGGEYRGLGGATRHAMGYLKTWGKFQTPADTSLDATFLDAGDHVVVLWRQKAHSANREAQIDLPAVSLYKIRAGKVAESRMYHSDTSAILRFLKGE